MQFPSLITQVKLFQNSLVQALTTSCSLLQLGESGFWGSQGRFSGKDPDSGPVPMTSDTILKDLDLDMKLKLPEEWHQRCASAPQHTGACLHVARLLGAGPINSKGEASRAHSTNVTDVVTHRRM